MQQEGSIISKDRSLKLYEELKKFMPLWRVEIEADLINEISVSKKKKWWHFFSK